VGHRIAARFKPRIPVAVTIDGMRTLLRYGYVPLIAALAALAVWLADREAPRASLGLIVVAAMAASFASERILPVDPDWNRDHSDRGRDVLHTIVNEGTLAASLALLPTLSDSLTVSDAWPHGWPVAVEVLVAILVFDAGVTWRTSRATGSSSCGASTPSTTASDASTA
jgi:sterol desaturase/sphingolipid hydroxylase (fatty acid hydroxylase superfamily)